MPLRSKSTPESSVKPPVNRCHVGAGVDASPGVASAPKPPSAAPSFGASPPEEEHARSEMATGRSDRRVTIELDERRVADLHRATDFLDPSRTLHHRRLGASPE